MDELPRPRARRQARAPAADAWVALEDPRRVSRALVPGTLRVDERRVGRSPYESVTACDIDDDGRRPLRQMRARPNRWLCKLQVAFRTPGTGAIGLSFGSGLLIGERHVLTAAHVLMEPHRDATGAFQQALDAAAVVVIPGLDGRRRRARPRAEDTMPFGWTHGTAFRAARVFRLANQASGAEPKDFDYAVIRLADPIGSRRFAALGHAPLGYWGYPAHRGRTLIRVKTPASLRRVRVNAVGYPSDKCRDGPVGRRITRTAYDGCPVADLGSVPWYSFDRIESGGSEHRMFSVLQTRHDVAPGMSGGPVWLRWRSVRNLIGILHACDPQKTEASPFRGALATLITDNVLRDIRAWTA